MIKTLKRIFTTTLLAAMLLAPAALLPARALAADNTTPDCTGANSNIQGCLSAGACLTTTTPDSPCTTGTDTTTKVNSILVLVINIFSLVVGVVAVIMIIIGGLKYITSGGESSNVTSAKNTILYAIVGLVIVALAQVIVHFVLQKVS